MYTLKLGLVAWLCCWNMEPVQAGKVLVLPIDGSPWLSMKVLLKELVRKGHEVLVLIPEHSLLIKESERFNTLIYEVPFTMAELDENFKELKDSMFLKPASLTNVKETMKLLLNYTTKLVKACRNLMRN